MIMADDRSPEIQMAELREIKEFSINDFINFSIIQSLKSASEDLQKFTICVSNIESLMCDELDDDTDYQNAIKAKEAELKTKMKLGEEDKRDWLMAQFKFRLLIKKIKMKIPKEERGVLS